MSYSIPSSSSPLIIGCQSLNSLVPSAASAAGETSAEDLGLFLACRQTIRKKIKLRSTPAPMIAPSRLQSSLSRGFLAGGGLLFPKLLSPLLPALVLLVKLKVFLLLKLTTLATEDESSSSHLLLPCSEVFFSYCSDEWYVSATLVFLVFGSVSQRPQLVAVGTCEWTAVSAMRFSCS